MSIIKAGFLPVLAFIGALLVSNFEGEFALLLKALYAVSLIAVIAWFATRPQEDAAPSG